MKKSRLLRVAIMMLPLLLTSLWSYGQTVKVSGTVSEANGSPLPGANIKVVGTTTGTITTLEGAYEIDVPANGSLEISSMGFVTQVVEVNNQKVINVTLENDATLTEEVVVVGYGTVKKTDITGSVTSVKSEALIANAPTTIQQALQGKAAGVIISGGNTVNSVPNIRIRGNRSIGANNDPLFVVDGIPLNGGLETFNPNDIQSVEILKDASSTAIYGSRGANGVILVTTKKGEAGKIVVEYDGYFSLGKLDRYRKSMNAGEFADLVREGNRRYIYDGNGGYQIDPSGTYSFEEPNFNADMATTYFSASWDPYINQSVRNAWDGGVYDPSKLRAFDWQMAGFREQSTSQNHSISVKGGSDKTKVFLSGSFMDTKDISLQSFRKRYTLHLNLDQKIGKRAVVGSSINYIYLDWNDGKGIPTFWSPLGNPYFSPKDPTTGLYDYTQPGDPANGLNPHPAGEPLQFNSFYDLDGVVRSNKRNNINANFYLDLEIVKGLKYRANFGSSFYNSQKQAFYGHFSTVTGLGVPKANQDYSFERSFTFENILSYNNKFGNHSLGATLVQSSEKFVSEPGTINANGLPIESQLWYALGSGTTQSVTSGFTQYTMMSWLGRVNYGFDDKYLLTASLRYDGSSRLAEGKKWVAFPSVALAWRISQESFLANNSVISDLKLRLTYGVTGNSAVAAYSTIGQIEPSRYNWAKDVGVMGYAPKSLSNSQLSWETTASYNIGLDFGIIRGRVSGTVEFYNQRTYDLLMTRTLPTVSGFGNITQNIGETQNQGVEVSLNTVNITSKDFEWSTDFTFSTNKEEITKLATGLPSDIGNRWFVGQPIDTYYDYVAADKVWGYSKEDMDAMAVFNANGSAYKPGDLRLVDLNGDNRINDADRQIRGSKMPKYQYGMANNFRYGPFDLYVFLYGAVGNTVYWDPGVGLGGRSNTVKVHYWTPKNPDTKYLAPPQDMQMPSNISAMYYWKGDYLKISDITVGYNLPEVLIQKIKIQKVKVYAKIQNPFMFTKFEGNDPEGAIGQQRNGTTLNTYGDQPYTMRMYQFGLNITF